MELAVLNGFIPLILVLLIANQRLLGLEQNNLHELWALLNVLYPEVLSSSSAFDEGFRIGALYQVRRSIIFRLKALHLAGSRLK